MTSVAAASAPSTRARERVSGAGPTLTEQCAIEKRLGRPGLLEGVTTDAIFRDRLRVHLVRRGLANIPAGTYRGIAESWSEKFLRWYGEPLVLSQPQQPATGG